MSGATPFSFPVISAGAAMTGAGAGVGTGRGAGMLVVLVLVAAVPVEVGGTVVWAEGLVLQAPLLNQGLLGI